MLFRSNATVDALAAGEVLPGGDTFTVEAADGTSHAVTVTITGANDGPAFTSAGTSGHALSEGDAGLAASGSVAIGDVDVSDTVDARVAQVTVTQGTSSAAVAGLTNAELLAMLTLAGADASGTVVDAIAAGAVTGVLDYAFDTGSESFDALAAGEVLELTYQIEITDEHGASATRPVVITITGTDDGPVAVDDTGLSVVEDGSIQIDVLGNDTHPEGDVLTVTAIAGLPVNAVNSTITIVDGSTVQGEATLLPNGEISFTPAPDYFGIVTFTYEMRDEDGDPATATVVLEVTPETDVPLAQDDTFGVVAGQTTTIDWSSNDDDPDNGTLTVVEIAGVPIVDGGPGIAVPNGIVRLDGGVLYFDADPGSAGTTSFIYTIENDGGERASARIDGSITLSNDPPTASADPLTVAEDTPGTGVVTASDPDGDPLTFTVTTPPSNESVTIQPDGTYTYTPAPDYNGPDSFQVTVTDGYGGTSVVTVPVDVTPVNDAPSGSTDDETTTAGTPVSGVLTMSDPDGDPLTPGVLAQPPGGTVSILPDGTWTFTPDPGTVGPVSFVLTVFDGTETVEVPVTVTVLPAPEAPQVDLDGPSTASTTSAAVYTEGDAPVAIVAADAIVVDPDSSQLVSLDIALSGFSGPAQTIGTGAGTFTYGTAATLSADFEGTTLTLSYDGANAITVSGAGAVPSVALEAALRSFEYAQAGDILVPDQVSFSVSAFDGTLTSNIAVATVDLVPVNGLPVAQSVSVSTPEDTPAPLDFPLPVDPEGGTVTVTIVSLPDPSQGTITYVPDGGGAPVAVPANAVLSAGETTTLVFEPAPDYNGPVGDLVAVVADPHGGETVISATIDIVAVEDVATVTAPPATTPEDTPVSGAVTISTPDAVTPAVTLGQPPANGVVMVNPDGTYTYTPAPDFNGPDSFTVIVDDATPGGQEVTVDVTVTPVDDAPVTTPLDLPVVEGTPVAIDLTSLFTDIDGPAITPDPSWLPPDLPPWLSLDPSGQLVGTVPEGISGNGPIIIEITVPGPNGPVPAVVTLTPFGQLVPQAPIGVPDLPDVTPDEPRDGLGIDPVRPILVGAVNTSDSLDGTPEILTANGIVVAAAEGVQDLSPVASPDPVDPFLVAAVEAMGGFDGKPVGQAFGGEAGTTIGESTAGAGGERLSFPVRDGATDGGATDEGATDEGATDDGARGGPGSRGLSVDAPSDRIALPPAASDDLAISGFRFALDDRGLAPIASPDFVDITTYLEIATYKRGASLFLDVTESFDPEIDGEVLGYRIVSRGVERPDWVREVRDGFYVIDVTDAASRGADGMIDLRVIADMDDGRALEKTVRIDPVTGELVPLGEDGAPATFLGKVKGVGLAG